MLADYWDESNALIVRSISSSVMCKCVTALIEVSSMVRVSTPCLESLETKPSASPSLHVT